MYYNKKTSDNAKCYPISAYALTLENTMRNPNETRIFYEQLSSLINSIKRRNALITGGDFNSKTELEVTDQLVVGKYAKTS